MKTHILDKIIISIMNLYKNKLFMAILFICMVILAYNSYNTHTNSYTLEGFDPDSMFTGDAVDLDPFTKPFDTNSLPKYSNILGNKCLAGCESPSSSTDDDNTCVPNSKLKHSPFLYNKCPFKCNPNMFNNDENLKNMYADYFKQGYDICEVGKESQQCSGCIVDAYY